MRWAAELELQPRRSIQVTAQPERLTIPSVFFWLECVVTELNTSQLFGCAKQFKNRVYTTDTGSDGDRNVFLLDNYSNSAALGDERIDIKTSSFDFQRRRIGETACPIQETSVGGIGHGNEPSPA